MSVAKDTERRNGVNMHDNYIVGYSVNIKEKELAIQTVQSLDDVNGRGESIYFSEVKFFLWNVWMDTCKILLHKTFRVPAIIKEIMNLSLTKQE